MQTKTNQVASPTLGQVLEPLINILTWDESGKKPILMDEIKNITGLPPGDPTTTALFQLYADHIQQRLIELVRISEMERRKLELLSKYQLFIILSRAMTPEEVLDMTEKIFGFTGSHDEHRKLLRRMYDLPDEKRLSKLEYIKCC